MTTCPICRMELMREMRPCGDGQDVLCANCGPYNISGSMLAVFSNKEYSPFERAVISHAVRRAGSQLWVTTDFVKTVLRNAELPAAGEVLDKLLIFVSTESDGPGEGLDLEAIKLRAALGTKGSSGVRWAITQAIESGLLNAQVVQTIGGPDEFVALDVALSLKGWERVNELLRAAKDSRKAFMAMKFGDPQLDAIFHDHFKPAVFQTGFSLRRLDEEPHAGLIDDRMRVEIRTSRFLIADLTHGNSGAYWEAGYAEGLGRPVIYTCRKDVFDDVKQRPHFDTNHHQTVIWDPASIQDALNQLKAVIRVTLPSEAVLEDTGI